MIYFMEIIYTKIILYYYIMRRSFKKLLEYEEKLSGDDWLNFYNDIIELEKIICAIFDKLTDYCVFRN